ncbi:MAG: hypothetical protein HYX90_01005 [Chloroflexi bacterium]|nr:hypothetical protein [Chloroflexota bacterium]
MAGLRMDGQGWLRPVSNTPDGTLSASQRALEANAEPALFDVIEVGLLQPRPEPHQPENWVIDGTPWIQVQSLTPSQAMAFITPWIVLGPELLGNSTDRVPYPDPPAKFPNSLAVITPQSVIWHIITTTKGKRQTRAKFSVGGRVYDLAVTDPVWETRLSNLTYGQHLLNAVGIPVNARILFSLSLSEFQGSCFKLICGIAVV